MPLPSDSEIRTDRRATARQEVRALGGLKREPARAPARTADSPRATRNEEFLRALLRALAVGVG
jgi:hypothetical protein